MLLILLVSNQEKRRLFEFYIFRYENIPFLRRKGYIYIFFITYLFNFDDFKRRKFVFVVSVFFSKIIYKEIFQYAHKLCAIWIVITIEIEFRGEKVHGNKMKMLKCWSTEIGNDSLDNFLVVSEPEVMRCWKKYVAIVPVLLVYFDVKALFKSSAYLVKVLM